MSPPGRKSETQNSAEQWQDQNPNWEVKKQVGQNKNGNQTVREMHSGQYELTVPPTKDTNDQYLTNYRENTQQVNLILIIT